MIGRHKVEVQTGSNSPDPTKFPQAPKIYAVAEEKAVAAGENKYDFDISTLGRPRD